METEGTQPVEADKPLEHELPADETEQAEAEAPEPAPTALGRNYLLLVIILITVLVAWVISLLSGQRPRGETAVDTTAAPSPATASAPPQQQAPTMPTGKTPSVLEVAGSGQRAILAAPSQALDAGGPVYRMARLFDITERSETFQMKGLIRFIGQWADQRGTLDLDADAQGLFLTPEEAGHLKPEERVVVLRAEGQTRAYAVPVLRGYVGVDDTLGDLRVLVSWHFFPQAAACLIARSDGKPIHWRDAGLTYRGADVYYDGDSGSLWNGLTGEALTGPHAGRAVGVLAVEVWTFEDWRTENPDGKVLAATPGGGVPPASPEPYLQSTYLPPGLVVYGRENSALPAKQFVLGLVVDGKPRAYPLGPLAEAQQEAIDSLGGRRVEVRATSPRTGHVRVEGERADAAAMLWFAWKELHPDTTVYAAAGD
ncbi:MAG: DUF3179 domain-containing (seleno)protein [Candidatus Brocadiia bacterium]